MLRVIPVHVAVADRRGRRSEGDLEGGGERPADADQLASVPQLGQSIEGGEITDGTIGPDDLASFSVTQPKIAPSSIYDAAINLDAFISGTKINPRFGSQNIQTDGWIGTDTPEHATELRAGNQVALRLIPHAGFGQAGVSVVAGINNFVTANQFGETVGGGQQNSVYDDYGTVAGGYRNAAGANDGTENNDFATVGGGDLDEAFGQYSTVPGGLRNIAGGPFSFAAGRRAIVRVPVQSGDFDGDEGTFVWADSQDVDFLSSGPNQFLIRAAGGVGIGTNTPQGVLQLGSSSDAAAVRFGNASSRHHMISNRDFVLNAFDTDGALNGSALFIFRRNTTKFDESGFANLAVLSDGGDLTIFGATATKPGGGASRSSRRRSCPESRRSARLQRPTRESLRGGSAARARGGRTRHGDERELAGQQPRELGELSIELRAAKGCGSKGARIASRLG